jgi:hypothetical protein
MGTFVRIFIGTPAAIAAVLLWIFRETVSSFFVGIISEKALKEMTWLIEYGPPAVLACVTLVALYGLLRHGVVLRRPELVVDGKRQLVRIMVRNKGREMLEKCLLQIVAIEPLPNEVAPDRLPITIPTEGQERRGDGASWFWLRPFQKKFATIVRYARGNNRDPISIVTEGEGFRLFPFDHYMITVSASAEKGDPHQVRFGVRVDHKTFQLVLSRR